MSTKHHLHIRALTEGAMLVAAAQVLSLIKLYEFPQGGSVTAAMFPILLYAVRWGLGRRHQHGPLRQGADAKMLIS